MPKVRLNRIESFDLSICVLGRELPGSSVAWSVHVGVIPNPVYALCIHHSDLFQSREKDQDCCTQ